MKYLRSLILTAGLSAMPGIATGDDHGQPYCLTNNSAQEAITARADAQTRRLARRIGISKADVEALASSVSVTKEGEIAVLRADETLVSPRNPFDLSGRAIRFMRRNGGFAVGREKPGFARPIGRRIDLNDLDSQWVDFDHGAVFPFGDTVHTGMYINSIGSLTFDVPDRFPILSVPFLVGGPPRIVPMMHDFHPHVAPGKGGIYYWVNRKTLEIRVTWFKVPIRGSDELATFQVRLRPDGRITFAYDEVETGDGVVGVFPPSEGVRVLDLRSELPAPPASGAVAEEFSSRPELNHSGFARAFLENFADDYDYVSTWFDFDVGGFGFFHAAVRNSIEGTGRGIFDSGERWGSSADGRLTSYLFMNSLEAIPDDPDENIREDDRPTSVIEILGHEVGHRWGSFVRFLDPRDGQISEALLGRQLAHWNFNMDTDASVMQGNDIADNGDGTFTTVDAWVGYSDLDLYLMGFKPPAEVAPFFYVEGPNNPPKEEGPRIGVQLAGERVDVALDDVIAVEGERVPASDASQKDFRIAFILVTWPGEEPKEESLAKLDAYRQRWESWWSQATGSAATFDTTLDDPISAR